MDVHTEMLLFFLQDVSETQQSAQRGSSRPDIPADIRPKSSVSPSNPGKNNHFGMDMPLGRSLKKLDSEKVRADFLIPNLEA